MNSVPLSRRRQRSSGVALVITLAFLVLVMVVMIGFFNSSRLDRSAAGMHLARARATSFAHEGVQRTVATLQQKTTYRYQQLDTDGVTRTYFGAWTSQPGALIVPAKPLTDPNKLGDPTASSQQSVLLSSGAPTATGYSDSVYAPPNLNIQTLADQNPPTYLITDRPDATTGNAQEMKLRWIYVRENRSASATDPSQWTYEYYPDPTKVPADPDVPTLDPTKPVVGRFAYWADDESSKVNYNLAWKRNTAASTVQNNSAESHPSRVNLTALTLSGGTPMSEDMADALHNWTTTSPSRFFNSFADGRQVDATKPGVAQMLNYNKFELTHYNQDPDTTFFGEDRIMLTTNRDLVPKNPDGTYARKFLDIMRDDRQPSAMDPGNLDDIAGGQSDWGANANGSVMLPNKLDAVIKNLLRYLSAKNWPLTTATVSFKDKYYPGTSDTSPQLAQIAVNIIDYVRAKESPTQVIAPMRFAVDTTTNKYTLNGTYANGQGASYQGICRTPLATEMGMWMEATPTLVQPGVSKYKCYFKAELYLPANYGFPSTGLDLVPNVTANPGWYVNWTELQTTGQPNYYWVNPAGALVPIPKTSDTNAVPIFAADVKGADGTVLKPGKYVTITKVFYRDLSFDDNSTLKMRVLLFNGTPMSNGLLGGGPNRWPRVQAGPQTQGAGVSYIMSPPTTVQQAGMCSLEVDDPRCNVNKGDWRLNATGNTFGAVNSNSTLGKTPTAAATVPQQDTDSTGMISDASTYMPPPKGVGSNDAAHDNGRVVSIGELGFVHTGINASGSKSTPWRTIRLQPNRYADINTLPDWALMDLFTVPNKVTDDLQGMYQPHGTSVGGRVNVNSHVDPFSTMVRDRGLVALLTGASTNATTATITPPLKTLAVTQAQTIADAIYNRTLATGTNKGKAYGYPWTQNSQPTDTNSYDTPGEICEIKGVADGGEQSEDLVREISSLVTERTDVFTVYTIGQSIKQTSAGKLVVESEQRQQAQVERYLDATDNTVKFRTVYFRNLTP